MTLTDLSRMYLHPRALPDRSRYACVQPLLLGQGEIITGRFADAAEWEHGWCYDTLEGALQALEEWDGADGTEPTGWVRMIRPDGPIRRRPGGDPAREYVDRGE